MPENYIGDLIRSRNILSIYPARIYSSIVAEGEVIRLDNLYGLYELGTRIQEMSDVLAKPPVMIPESMLPLARARDALLDVLTEKIIPVAATKDSANKLLDLLVSVSTVKFWRGNWQNPLNESLVDELKAAVVAFQYALSEELRQVPVYSVKEKGNLSRSKLIQGANLGYDGKFRSLADNTILIEIDESGRCLAFGRFTACGFHILRAVEICTKAYIYAVKGELPKLRNWGKYLEALEKAGASDDLVDLVKILKAKRNPLMHPQDTLKLEDATALFSICQAVMEFLGKEVLDRNIDAEFKEALNVLPTLPTP
jgi:HEPN domain-containing protein